MSNQEFNGPGSSGASGEGYNSDDPQEIVMEQLRQLLRSSMAKAVTCRFLKTVKTFNITPLSDQDRLRRQALTLTGGTNFDNNTSPTNSANSSNPNLNG